MPKVITEDFAGGKPTVEEVDYKDLPLSVVAELAVAGDEDAKAWLAENEDRILEGD